MAIQTWSPDTCLCVIEREYDDTLPVEKREYVVTNAKFCAEHDVIKGDLEEKFSHVLENNQRKNIIERELLLSLSDFTEIKNGQPKWKDDCGMVYNYEGIGEDRKLFVSVIGKTITKSEKDNIQILLEEKMGQNKIEIA